jgi:Tol biopolymer transport system component
MLAFAGAAILLGSWAMETRAAWGSKRDENKPLSEIKKSSLTRSQKVEEPSTAVTGVSPITPKSMKIAAGFYNMSEGKVLWASRIDISRNTQPGEKMFLLFSAKQGDDDHFHIWKKQLPSSQDGGIVKVTADQADDTDPVLSRDGRQVFFASNRIDNKNTLWRTNISGVGGITKITGSQTGAEGRVDISADGKKLLLVSTTLDESGMSNMMWMVNTNGTELTQLRPGDNPRWSADSKKILFDFAGQIWLMDVDGGDTTQLTSGRGGFMPYWSPDGSEIVFASQQKLSNGKEKIGIWKMKKDGSELTQLTLNESTDLFPIWSPTNEIYFLSNRGRERDEDFGLWKLQLKIEKAPDAAPADKGL